MLWADPVDDISSQQNFTLKELQEWQHIEFLPNTKRQTSVFYGCLGLQKFLENNNCVSVVRAHEVTDEGFKKHHFFVRSSTPLCITLFSAPNYCDLYYNRAAVMEVTPQTYRYLQFSAQPHPFNLPDFSDAFSFATPYLMESLVTLLSDIVIDIKEEDPSETSEEEQKMNKDLEAKTNVMKSSMAMREKLVVKLNQKRQKLLANDHRIFICFNIL